MDLHQWKQVLDANDLIFYPGTGGTYTKGPDGKLEFYIGFARQNTQLQIIKFYCESGNQEVRKVLQTLCLIHGVTFINIVKA